jgi:predicted nucleic acid-binding Zn ribbon protein
METRRCVVCGIPLPPDSRQDKITCGGRCRKRLSRARHRPSEIATRALDEVYNLAWEAHNGLFESHAYAELAWLCEYVTRITADVAANKPPEEWWSAD